MASGQTVRRGGACNRLAEPHWKDPLDTSFSKQHGGRWNAPGSYGVLYLNVTERMARIQVEHKLAGQPYGIEDLDPASQHDLVEVDVAETDALDLVHDDGLQAVGLPVSYPHDADGQPGRARAAATRSARPPTTSRCPPSRAVRPRPARRRPTRSSPSSTATSASSRRPAGARSQTGISASREAGPLGPTIACSSRSRCTGTQRPAATVGLRWPCGARWAPRTPERLAPNQTHGVRPHPTPRRQERQPPPRQATQRRHAAEIGRRAVPKGVSARAPG